MSPVKNLYMLKIRRYIEKITITLIHGTLFFKLLDLYLDLFNFIKIVINEILFELLINCIKF